MSIQRRADTSSRGSMVQTQSRIGNSFVENILASCGPVNAQANQIACRASPESTDSPEFGPQSQATNESTLTWSSSRTLGNNNSFNKMARIIDIQKTKVKNSSPRSDEPRGEQRMSTISSIPTVSNNHITDSIRRAESQQKQQVNSQKSPNQWEKQSENLSSFESDYDLLVYLGETETEDIVETERSLDYQDQTWRQSICGGASLAPTIDTESLSELISSPIQPIDGSPQSQEPDTPTNPDMSVSPFSEFNQIISTNQQRTPDVRQMNGSNGDIQTRRVLINQVNQEPEKKTMGNFSQAEEKLNNNDTYMLNGFKSSMETKSSDTKRRSGQGTWSSDTDELDRLLAEMSQTLDLESLSKYDTSPYKNEPSVQKPRSNIQKPKGSDQLASSVKTVEERPEKGNVNKSNRNQPNDASSGSILEDYDDASRMLELMITNELSTSRNINQPSASKSVHTNKPPDTFTRRDSESSVIHRPSNKSTVPEISTIIDPRLNSQKSNSNSPTSKDNTSIKQKNSIGETKTTNLPRQNSAISAQSSNSSKLDNWRPEMKDSKSRESEIRRRSSLLRRFQVNEPDSDLPPEPPAVDYSDYSCDDRQNVIEAQPISYSHKRSQSGNLSDEKENQLAWMKRRTLSSMRSMRDKFNDFMSNERGKNDQTKSPNRPARSRSTKRREPIKDQLVSLGQRIRRHLSRSKSRLGNMFTSKTRNKSQRAHSVPDNKHSDMNFKGGNRKSSVESSLSGLDTTGSVKIKPEKPRSRSRSQTRPPTKNSALSQSGPRSSSLLSIKRLSSLKGNDRIQTSDMELESTRVNHITNDDSRKRRRLKKRKQRSSHKSDSSDTSSQSDITNSPAFSRSRTGDMFKKMESSVSIEDNRVEANEMRHKSSLSLNNNRSTKQREFNDKSKGRSQSMRNITNETSTVNRRLPIANNTFRPASSIIQKDESKISKPEEEVVNVDEPRVEASPVNLRVKRGANIEEVPVRPPRRSRSKSAQARKLAYSTDHVDKSKAKLSDSLSTMVAQLKQSAITAFQMASPGPIEMDRSRRGQRPHRSSVRGRAKLDKPDIDGPKEDSASLCHWTPVIGQNNRQSNQYIGAKGQPKAATLAAISNDWRNETEVGLRGKNDEDSKGSERDQVRSRKRSDGDNTDSTWESESEQSSSDQARTELKEPISTKRNQEESEAPDKGKLSENDEIDRVQLEWRLIGIGKLYEAENVANNLKRELDQTKLSENLSRRDNLEQSRPHSIGKKKFKFHEDLPDPSQLSAIPSARLEKDEKSDTSNKSIDARVKNDLDEVSNRLSVYENVPPPSGIELAQSQAQSPVNVLPVEKPRPRLVTMTSIIQDPNDELMMVSCFPRITNNPAQTNSDVNTFEKSSPKTENSPTKPFRPQFRRSSRDAFGDDNNDYSDDTDSSLAGPTINNRQKLLRRLEKHDMLGFSDKIEIVKADHGAERDRARESKAQVSGSLVKKLAKSFDKSPQDGKTVALTKHTNPQMVKTPSIDEESKSESVWYDAQSMNTDLDEAEVAEFLKGFDQGPNRGKNESVSMSTDADQFVTVDDGNGEGSSSEQDGARMDNYDDNDDTLNDADRLDGDDGDSSCLDEDPAEDDFAVRSEQVTKRRSDSNETSRQGPSISSSSDKNLWEFEQGQQSAESDSKYSSGIPVSRNMVKNMASSFSQGRIPAANDQYSHRSSPLNNSSNNSNCAHEQSKVIPQQNVKIYLDRSDIDIDNNDNNNNISNINSHNENINDINMSKTNERNDANGRKQDMSSSGFRNRLGPAYN